MATKKKSTKKAQKRPPDEKLKSILEHIRPEFAEGGARRIGPGDVERLLKAAGKVRGQFRNVPPLQTFREDATLALKMVEDFQNGSYQPDSYWAIAVITFGLRYVIQPVDVIPDAIPVIGRLDDAMVVALCLAMVKPDLHAYRVWRMVAELQET